MTIAQAEDCLLYKVIAGSKAYGLSVSTSDTDIRGIYMLPNETLLGFGYTQQAHSNTNDIMYYELNRFMTLLLQNNPNIIEILFVPEDKIIYMDEKIMPLYEHRHRFLSKKIKHTFGGYAVSQIKKARGLNKKIVQKISEEKKTPLDFCYIFEKDDGYMMTARQWLKKHNCKQENIGLAAMPNGEQLYKVYYDCVGDIHGGFRGIVGDNSDDIRHSEIPKGFPLAGFLYYNKDGYITHCKEYKEYWDWVKKRNPARYAANMKHGKGYDGKNLMHCIRMLEMAIEIAQTGNVNLVRPNRDFLLSIRNGEIEYEDILDLVEKRKAEMEMAFEKTNLPEEVDINFAHDILIKIRTS